MIKPNTLASKYAQFYALLTKEEEKQYKTAIKLSTLKDIVENMDIDEETKDAILKVIIKELEKILDKWYKV